MKYFKKKDVFVIGEIGLNHDGSLEKCKQLIKMASEAKFDAVKLQISSPDDSYDTRSKSYKYFKKFSLSKRDLPKIQKYAKSKKIILFATVGDIKSIESLKLINSPIVKISSGLINNYPLIKKIAKLNKPIIISTGLAFKKEVEKTAKLIKKFNSKQLGVLLCTSLYPSEDYQLKVSFIEDFKKKFKNSFIGYSDHSNDNLSSYVAVSLGAQIIEKHITLKRKNFGDHIFALEAKRFKEFINNIKRISIIKLKNKLPLKEEIPLRKTIHRFVVAKQKILKGQKFSEDNISLKRTLDKSKGININNYDNILGKKAKVDINKNFKIKESHIIK